MSLTNYSFDLFVSHCGVNKKEVYKLCDELKNKGFKLWIDKNEMVYGNVDELMKKGIDESKLFMCCATTAYCESKNCLAEFNYAVSVDKKIIYVIFEKFADKIERASKLSAIALRLAGQKFYKCENIDGIVTAIKALVQ